MNRELANEPCGFNEPTSVVSAFIAAMNKWEIESWNAMQAARESEKPFSYQEGVSMRMKKIFDLYCTKKERKYGRLGSFQQPPVYDLSMEKIISIAIDEKSIKAVVESEREAILSGGKYRYVLFRKNGKWLIDNLKHERNRKWERAIL